MPVYNGEHSLPQAVESLLAQPWQNWELIIVDDGSSDETKSAAQPFLRDGRIILVESTSNQGLGAALNRGTDLSTGAYIAYLPADDVYYIEHLKSLMDALDEHKQALLAYSGIHHNYNRTSTSRSDFPWLQLVQVLHRRTRLGWVERAELVTDDLGRMFWEKLEAEGEFIGTGMTTCNWVSHPDQRHKILREPEGGINRYREFYAVQQQLCYHSSVGNRIDEVRQYQRFRERRYRRKQSGLKILLAGELAYNAERVLALKERGHELYGLWMPRAHWYNSVGPVPFGHIKDVPRERWVKTACSIKPDIIYALLNWQAVPFVHHVMKSNPGIPFVWHFKEGPFICIGNGTWHELSDLYRYSDGQIFCSSEMQQWFNSALPNDLSPEKSFILDGDLPKREWFAGEFSPKLSSQDGEFHTVIPGRPIGLHPEDVEALGRNGIHLHFYGDYTHGQWKSWIETSLRRAPRHLHLHSQVHQDSWVREFSRYDAGWLHFFASQNKGDIRRAIWDDLNVPARMSALAAAGLPFLQRDNSGSIVASQSLAHKLNSGIFFTTAEELAEKLRDSRNLQRVQESIREKRIAFSFDAHADSLTEFFKATIGRAQSPARQRKVVPFQALGRTRSGRTPVGPASGGGKNRPSAGIRQGRGDETR